MNQLFLKLRPLIRWVMRCPAWTFFLSLLLTAASLVLALRLNIDTDIARLLPPTYPSVQALERLRDTVGSESSLSVIIESPSFEANKAFADTLIPRALAVKREGSEEPYLVRVDYQKDTDFLERNALYFATDAELNELEIYLKRRRAEAVTQSNPLLAGRRRSRAPDEGIRLEETYREMIGTEYPVSPDSMTLVVRFYASGAQTNLRFVSDLYEDMEALVDSLNTASFHPQLEAFVGGRLQRQLVEVRAIQRDVIGSFGGGVGTVILVVVMYFLYKGYRARGGSRRGRARFWAELKRTPVTALLIGVPLAMSLAWTFGYAYLAHGFLNLMTSTLVLVLFGLGVDYGIHFYARYLEERAAAYSIQESVEHTFLYTGPAIAVSAFTTAASLLVLIFADFRGFSQFGSIAGVGILLSMTAMLLLQPALIILFVRAGWLPKVSGMDADSANYSDDTRPFPWARTLLLASLVLAVVAGVPASRVSFEYRFGELEPDFPRYEALRAREGQVYPTSKRNPAYILADDPSDVPKIAEILRERAAADTLSPTILSVESLQERFPESPEAEQRRLDRLAEIRRLLDDPYLRTLGGEDVARLHQAAQTTAPVPLDSVPDFLKSQFMTRSGEVGAFVVIYPSVGLSHGRNSMAFADDVGQVTLPNGRTYVAASTSIVGADMLRLLIEESPWMILYTCIALLVLLWTIFRSIRWTLLAAAPLIIGALWMLGVMGLLGISLNFYNLVVLPAVLGIGIDGGVHVVHRYREEGPNSVWRVMRSTGEHVAAGSLTTLIAFAWWLFSFHPGLNSIGQLALAGITSVLIAALVTLPAYLQWRENWQRDVRRTRTEAK